MKRPGFLEGAGVALAAAAAGTVLHTALTPLVSQPAALRAVIAGIGLTYLLYLLSRSPERLGRLTAVAAWVVMAAAAWLLHPPLPLYVLLHLGSLWLVRSLYFHARPLAALADLGLTLLALAAAVWATLETASLFLALWCLFLVQALFVVIPSRPGRSAPPGSPGAAEEDGFRRAHRAAEAAVRRLSSIR